MTQNTQILEMLKNSPKGITAIDALEKAQCFRLAEGIKNLRDEGHQIETKRESKNGKTYARYWLSAAGDH